MQRDTVRMARRQRFGAVAGFGDGLFQYRQMAWLCSEHLAAQGDRIAPAEGGEFVDRRIRDETVDRVTHRSPPQDRHEFVGRMHLDSQVRDGVGHVRRALVAGGIDAILHHHVGESRLGQHRLADAGMKIGHRHAARIDARADPIDAVRAVVAAVHVVLARPDGLDRLADALRDECGFDDEIRAVARAPSEATAEEGGVQHHLLRREAERFGDHQAVHRLVLRADPQLAAIRRHLRHAVQRLHAGMREIRQLVFDIEAPGRGFQCRDGIARIACDAPRLLREFAPLLAQRRSRQVRAGTEVPVDDQRVAAALRSPGVLRDHGDATRHFADLDHARDRARGRVVEAADRRAECRRPRDHGREHAGKVDVETELRSARDLLQVVEPLLRSAEIFEIAPRLQSDFLRHRQRGGHCCERTVGGAAPAIGHHAIFGAQRCSFHVPLLRRGSDQHRARRGAGLAQGVVRGGRAHAAAGELHLQERMIERRIDAGEFHAHPLRVDVEFLGRDHRQAGVHALAHFRFADDHGHRVIAGNAQIRARIEIHRRASAGGVITQQAGHHVDSRSGAGRDDTRADQEVAPTGIHIRFAHDASPAAVSPRLIAAARFTAARMRG